MSEAVGGLFGWAVLGLPAFLFVITVVVFFHELGHFLAARAFGIAVDSFSIGFGRELAGWTDRKGTRWKISLLPLGGYVKFTGDADVTSRPDKSVKAVRAVAAATSAEEGQLIVAEASGSTGAVAGAAQHSEATRTPRSPQLKDSLHFKPLHQRAMVAAAGPAANFLLAIVLFTVLFMVAGRPSRLALVGNVMPNSAAAEAGLMPGDLIRSVDGMDVASFAAFQQAVRSVGARRLTLEVERDGRQITLNATPRPIEVRDETGQMRPVVMLGANAGREAIGPLGALRSAVGQVWFIVAETFRMLGGMIIGETGTDQLSGPIGIAKISGDMAALGFFALVNLAALISVSIGLINLFPIPVLDGGHLLYYAVEAVRGRPLGERAQEIGFRIGLAFVLCLMLFATFNDLLRFAG